LIVGVVAVPLALAFAIASGVSPEKGLITAFVAGFLVSFLGGSRVQIGGPTGAFVVIVYGIVQQHGVDGLAICTLMAGVLLIGMGLARFGGAIKFIPYPVVTGFTSGIAVIIFSSEVKDLLGLRMGTVPAPFLEKWQAFARAASTVSPASVVLSISSLAVLLLWPRVSRRVPAPIVAILLATAAVAWFGLPVETIGSRFGNIPSALPAMHVPDLSVHRIRELFSPALTVALLCAIESLLSAVVADRMSRTRHNSNVELFAQGVANIVSPMFGGLPATGAIARTATNVRSGAKTPVAGVIHALTLLMILLFAAPLAGSVPMAVLAAILLVVAYNMGEWREIPELWKQGWTDRIVWLWTFALTVFADLTVAVEAGMIIAALLFIRRVSATTTVSRVTSDYIRRGRVHALQDRDIPDYVTIFRIHGPFLFGSTDKLAAVAHATDLAQIVVLRLRNMTAIDATGLRAIQDLADSLHASGRSLLLCGAPPQPAQLMDEAEFHRHVGEENILPHVEAALTRAGEIWAARTQPRQEPPAA
jgi:SulP family sulfate permease